MRIRLILSILGLSGMVVFVSCIRQQEKMKLLLVLGGNSAKGPNEGDLFAPGSLTGMTRLESFL
jgi:hypothetical protein